MLMGFWKLKNPEQATENYDKGKNEYLCELTSTIAKLWTDMARFKKKNPNDIFA